MKPEDAQRDRQALEIFGRALDLPVPEARAAYLAEACGGDAALRARVETLLAHHLEDTFLQAPAARLDPAATRMATAGESVGARIDRYQLIELLGEGGFGTVWLAEQKEPVRRKVALKVVRLGMDSRQVVARFEAERQALALMDHPHIAKVLDAGTTEAGRPYFVMELVRGIPITRFCDQTRLPVRERLDLFVKVCQAVQHAHQKGIIHRDLKPSNVLVTLHDGAPVPKVIDFGIAKATQQELTDRTLHTLFHQFVGTPAYTSPEQAEISGLDIDTRSDIYSLGVLLYELLTGVTPFDGKELLAFGLDEMRRIIRENEPPRPSTRLTRERLARSADSDSAARRSPHSALDPDLDWIVMKCLEKDRARRYETANGLAADLKRHLQGEPVVARPPSVAYRFGKLLRRNKPAFAAAAAVTAALLLGGSFSAWQALVATRAGRAARQAHLAERARADEASRERDRADEAREAVRHSLYAGDMKLAMQAWESGALGAAVRLLEAHRPDPGLPDLRGFEWSLLWRLCHQPAPFTLPGFGRLEMTALSPDGRWLAVGGEDGRLRLWNLLARQALELRGPGLPLGCLAFSPDGRWLATGTGGLFHPNQPGELRLWEVASAREAGQLRGHTLRLNSVTFSCDSRWLVSAGADRTVRAWDVATRQPVPGLVVPEAEGRWVIASPVDRIVAVGAGPTVQLLDLDTGRPRHTFGSRTEVVWSGAFSRDGRWLATGGADNLTMVHDVARGELVAVLPHDTVVSCLAFSPDGGTLACGTIDKVTLWDLARRRPSGALRGVMGGIIGLDFTPDGSTLVTSAEFQSPRCWDLRVSAGEEARTFGTNGVHALAVSPDGRYLAVGEGDFYQPFKPSAIHLWDLVAGREIQGLQGHAAAVILLAFGKDGRTLTSGGLDQTTRHWDVPSGRPIASGSSLEASPVTLAGVSPQGRVALWTTPDPVATNVLKVVDLPGGREVATFSALRPPLQPLVSAAFSPDGSLVAAIGEPGVATVWNIEPAERLATLPYPGDLTSLTFSPDGSVLLAGGSDGKVRRLEIRSGRRLFDLEGHRHAITSLAFSPDGTRLVTASIDRTLKLWNVVTGRELVALKGHQLGVMAVVFTPDGNTLISASADGEVRFWRATPLRE